MPSISYAFRKYGRKRLELSWVDRSQRGRWRDATLRLGGKTVGALPGWTDATAEREFSLPDGSTLTVQWDVGESAPRVLRDGRPLPSFTPEPEIQRACQFLFTGAGIGIVYGLVKLLQAASPQPADSGISYIVSGTLSLVLGFFVWRRSLAALGIAIALFALDTILLLFGGAASTGLTTGGRWPFASWLVILRVAIIWQLIQGARAIRAIREHDRVVAQVK